MHNYQYPRPAVTVDIAIFKETENGTELLLIQRKNEPFKLAYALPGGFVDENEALLSAALRELHEETSLQNIALTQFRTYGDPGRDPRGHTVSVVYYGFANTNHTPEAADDALTLAWFPVNQIPKMAFDHEVITRQLLVFLKYD